MARIKFLSPQIMTNRINAGAGLDPANIQFSVRIDEGGDLFSLTGFYLCRYTDTRAAERVEIAALYPVQSDVSYPLRVKTLLRARYLADGDNNAFAVYSTPGGCRWEKTRKGYYKILATRPQELEAILLFIAQRDFVAVVYSELEHRSITSKKDA